MIFDAHSDFGLYVFKENCCKQIVVSVASGHESVFEFYQKFNFYPKMTYLQLNDKFQGNGFE